MTLLEEIELNFVLVVIGFLSRHKKSHCSIATNLNNSWKTQ